jgi:hypothetical protein
MKTNAATLCRPLGQMRNGECKIQGTPTGAGKIIRCAAATGTPPLAISLRRNEKTFAAIKIAEQEKHEEKAVGRGIFDANWVGWLAAR